MQQGPEVEMTVKDSMCHCRIRGGPEDSLESVANATHTQFMFLFQKIAEDCVIAEWHDVHVVRPD